MTAQLKKVFTQIETLPATEQNALAVLLSEELKWKKSFSDSTRKLESLANEALAEYKKGKTLPLDLK